MKIITNHPVRKLATLCLLFVVCFNGMCSASRMALLKSALNAAPALTSSLVAGGVITQAQADGAVNDFTDGSKVAVQLGENMNAIPKDAPDRKQQEFNAAHKAFTDWRAIYARGNFGVHARINTAATIADGVFVFFEAYYADRAGQTPHTDVAVDGLSEDDFEDALDQKLRELKAAMKP